MYLKGLNIQGFKSFADKISLDFSNGITAIVGPNGSGKSNISDAVRWVLGEQSAKSLRGSKMEDVIFNGTQTRSPLGFAEVTLTLDNKDKTFHIDFDEVAITRKVFASGESQYLINKTPCRLKDIHEIFMDTGLGRDGYSMIGQGKIEEILSTKSEDRRQIFEEAAGISKYRYRKEEAQRKLSHTEENLSRVMDIILELENQLKPLQAQSEKAKKYLAYKEELKIYEVNVAIAVIETNKTQIKELEEKFQVAATQLESVKQEMEQAEKEQEDFYATAREKEEKVRESEKQLRDDEAKISLLKSEIEVLYNTIHGNHQLIERIKNETKEIYNRITEVSSELIKAEDDKKQLDEQRQQKENEIEVLNRQSEQMMSGAGQQNTAIASLKNEVIEYLNQIGDHKITLSNSDIIMQNLRDRKQRIDEELDVKLDSFEEIQNKLNQFIKERDRKIGLISVVETRLSGEREQEYELLENLEVNKNNLTQINIEVNDKKNRVNILTAMEQNFEGYSKSVKDVMKSHQSGQLKNAQIYGPVSKLVGVPDKYRVAIEVALGGTMQNIVVENESDAKFAIQFLKSSKSGRATFMPISAIKGNEMDDRQLRGERGFLRIASELVEYDRKYEGIVKNLLGKVVVVDNVDNGIALSRKFKNTFRIVTLDGEVFHVGGSMAGGSVNRHGNIMGREQEIKQLEKDIILLHKRYTQTEDSIKADEEVLKNIRIEIAKSSTVLNENKEVLLILNQDIAYHETIIKDFESAKAQLDEENKRLDDEIEKTKQDAAQSKLKIETLEKEVESKRKEVNALEQDFENVMNQKQKIADTIIERTVEKSAIVKDIAVAEDRISILKLDLEQYENNITLRNAETSDIEKKNAQLHEEIDNKKSQMADCTQAVASLNELIKTLMTEKQEFDQKSRQAQAKAKELREMVYTLTSEYNRLETKKVKLDVELENTINRLWDEYELTHSQALSYQTDIGLPVAANKKIAELRSRIRELGNVNVDAIEEYKNVKERYEFLTVQKDDLLKAKDNLNDIIAEMTNVMKKQFAEEFAKINTYFKSTFTELFGGGSASLTLTDPDNILDCGINIDVQPPGKKLQSLSLLSGGERALSAIALLFAILKSRPTPFCFLDEIEAALDDVNVYRFADYVKKYSQNTQFIIVTHRRGTMESADVIYGVTMQEKGVSKLLELNINEIAG